MRENFFQYKHEKWDKQRIFSRISLFKENIFQNQSKATYKGKWLGLENTNFYLFFFLQPERPQTKAKNSPEME